MRKKQVRRRLLYAAATLATAGLLALLFNLDYAVLDAKGTMASQQRNLILFATALSLLIILPVFVLTFHIVRTYRVGGDGSTKRRTKYQPDWDGSRKLEAIWWGVPTAIILVLSVVIWQSSHSLDPYRPIGSDKRPLTIQVVALQWKWLFIYPEQGIATVNHVRFPVDRPVNFQITADAPMNSFWIPQLGGQVYAMTGMTTKLHLMASETGSYEGSSANLSGDGFAGMRFKAQALQENEFQLWSTVTGYEQSRLTLSSYAALAAPSRDVKPAQFGLDSPQLFDSIVDKYMAHGGGH